MGEKKRKCFTSKFKSKVAIEAIRGVKTVNEIAQEFGAHPTQVGLWKKELQELSSRVCSDYIKILRMLENRFPLGTAGGYLS